MRMSKLTYSHSWNSLRQTQIEKKELNELNCRFVNFINLVKSEQNKCDTLTNAIFELKKKVFGEHAQNRQVYECELNATRQELNKLCFELNECVVKERSSRFLAQFYASFADSGPVIKYNCGSTSNNSNSNSNSDGGVGAGAGESGQEHLDYLAESDNLDKLSSAFSASQSSLLSSCSSQSLPVSSSSSSSSSSSTSSYSTDSVSVDSALPPSPTLFSLETYLTTLNQNRSHLNQEYEFKLAQCEKLKKQCAELNDKLFTLNNSLDTTRLENSTLGNRIERLKSEINFYKTSISSVSCSCTNTNSVGLFKCSQMWYANELDLLKRDIRQEFENSLQQDLESYEARMQDQILAQIDIIQQDYDKEYEKMEAESNALLNELSQLNESLYRDFDEYQRLRAQNTQLNNRMIELSSKLLDFNQMDQSMQDKMILNYSVKCLTKDVNERREQVNMLRKQLGQTKADLSQKNIFGFSQSQFNLKPFNAHIERTNMVSHLVVKFDFVHNSISGKNRSILNSLKLSDSTDGHWLMMENEHKLLDIDLSEWIIRREIYSSMDDAQPHQTIEYTLPKFFKLKRRKKVNFVCSTKSDMNDGDACSSLSQNSLPKLTQLKCACCACKLMVKRNGDTDIMEVKEVDNWGCGSLIVTKLIENKKNAIKMANFKFLKQMPTSAECHQQNATNTEQQA